MMRNGSRQPDGVAVPGSVLAYDIETISAKEMPDGAFPPWPTHHVVAVGFGSAARRDGAWTIELGALVAGNDGEAPLVREAERQIAAAEVTTTYNGRGFDALVLRLAAQRNHLWSLPALAEHAAMPRFDARHSDLADLYASYGRKVSLSEICHELGIPVKTSTHGSDVAALWAEGERERIRTYVLEDACATLCLYWAWLAARAGDETLVARPLAALARTIETTPTLGHLQPFVECTLVRWARPRAMKVDISAALASVQRRLQREEQETRFVRSG